MLLRKPFFWIIFCLVSIACGWFTVRHFSKAFSIVNIDIKMDRPSALRESRALDAKYGWGPKGFRQAAAFDLDEQLRDYIELEAGGKEAFNRVINEGIVSPYTWIVRHFSAGQTLETAIEYTPDGRPYGFQVSLPETLAGINIPQPDAQKLAEATAATDWNVKLSSWSLVERSSERRISGRIDHTFVYERTDARIGEGRYRLRMIVSGNRLTSLARFVKIPEAFGLRYQKMRSANDTIASVAQIVVGLLYILGGAVAGMLLLLPRRWLLWKLPLLCGLVVALLQVLSSLNSFPLAWMSYDTAISYQGYIFQHLLRSLQGFLFDALLLTVSFMAAESLTRRAFPGQIRLWKIWSRDAAGSVQVAGRTAGGYLLVTVFLAYEVVLYFMTRHLPNWWAPSDTLFDPNILATYLPWLGPFADALHAGFWEESLFRAIPLACAALIGERFGGRRWWIIGTLIAQAVIFGAAHANYPNQPSYARLVEIILPSIGFGLLYLSFGLLPGIILHFSFDAVMMATPLFVAKTPGIALSQAIFLLLFFVPVWIVIAGRLRGKAWSELPGPLYNRAWTPALIERPAQEVPQAAEQLTGLPFLAKHALMIGLPAGVILFFLFANFRSDVPPLQTRRATAVAAAEKELQRRGIVLKDGWKTFAAIGYDHPGISGRFVWREGGRNAFERLVKDLYLPTPSWDVRFAKFSGAIPDRSEEYRVQVTDDGRIMDFAHRLPESRPGANLDEEQARSIAGATLAERYRLAPARLTEISAVPSRLPARTDWSFDFQNPAGYPLKEGQARVNVSLAGNEVNGTFRYVYVPEEWQRRERDRLLTAQIIGRISGILRLLLFLAGAIYALVGWTRKVFSLRIFFAFLILLLIVQGAVFFNHWPAIAFNFSAVEPLGNQVLTLLGTALVQIAFIAFVIALLNGFSREWGRTLGRDRIAPPVVLACGAAALLAAAFTIAERLLPSPLPLYPSLAEADSWSPLAGLALAPFLSFIKGTSLLLLLTIALGKLTGRWTKRTALFTPLLFLLGLVSAGPGATAFFPWIVAGLITGLFLFLGYRYLFRYNYALVPLTAGTISIFGALGEIPLRAFPAAVPGNVLSILLIGAAAWYWYRLLDRD